MSTAHLPPQPAIQPLQLHPPLAHRLQQHAAAAGQRRLQVTVVSQFLLAWVAPFSVNKRLRERLQCHVAAGKRFQDPASGLAQVLADEIALSGRPVDASRAMIHADTKLHRSPSCITTLEQTTTYIFSSQFQAASYEG